MRVSRIDLCALAIALLGAAALAGEANAACLSKPETGRNGEPRRAHVIAPEGEVASYRALGYVEACELSSEQIKQAVENICRIAAAAPREMREQVAASRGVSLTRLCASGRAGLAEMQANTEAVSRED